MKHFRSTPLFLLLSLLACQSLSEASPVLGDVEFLDAPTAEGAVFPRLAHTPEGVLMSWLEPSGPGWALRMAHLEDDAWSPPVTVAVGAEGEFMVNWADFPSVTALGQDRLIAHWLVRDAGRYGYSIRASQSDDSGMSWSEAWTPHEDGLVTEHGFVSTFPMGDGAAGLLWLDGRDLAMAGLMVDGEPTAVDGSVAAMTLRYRSVDASGQATPEVLVDDWVCDCCQPDVAITSGGPVAVYRNRTRAEIRDIYVTRLGEGVWSEGTPIHDDGWHMPGCPVNGPVISAQDEDVAVAWFTAPDGVRQVQVALSRDGGLTFAAPVRIDQGNPLGRADVLVLDGGTLVVTWMEESGDGAEILFQELSWDGELKSGGSLSDIAPARSSGFPRMEMQGDGHVAFAWTEPGDPGRLRVARMPLTR